MHNHFMRTAAFIVCLALVFGLFPVTAAAEGLSFTDVPETAWFYEDVRMAVESGLLHGRSQTRYEPEGSLTCAEAVSPLGLEYFAESAMVPMIYLVRFLI